MYYIRIHQYGLIRFGVYGFTDYLAIGRYKITGSGLSLPFAFESRAEAEKHCVPYNGKNPTYGRETTYHVIDHEAPFVRQWVEPGGSEMAWRAKGWRRKRQWTKVA